MENIKNWNYDHMAAHQMIVEKKWIVLKFEYMGPFKCWQWVVFLEYGREWENKRNVEDRGRENEKPRTRKRSVLMSPLSFNMVLGVTITAEL